MRIAFVMDPFEQLDGIDEDTSCCLIQECLDRGHSVLYVRVECLRLADGLAVCAGQWVLGREGEQFILSVAAQVALDGVDVIFMRKDPPVDLCYLNAVHVLGRVSSGTMIINSPESIERVNEKLYILDFPDFAPRSIVTCSPEQLGCFLRQVGGEMVVKPLNECSGRGVIYVHLGDLNMRSILEMVTADGRRFVMGQEFLPEVREKGDRRLLMLSGHPLGMMSRIPAEGEYRSNIHQGGRCELATMSASDNLICAALGPRLVADGIYFAGIDVIGSKMIEVNITSPAGIPEINRLTGARLETTVIDWVEQVVCTRRRQ